MKKLLLMSISVTCMPLMIHAVFGPKTFFINRSPSLNAVRELAGWQKFINHAMPDRGWYTAFSIVPEYDRTTHSSNLADYLFGGKNFFCSGSQVEKRGDRHILADYFGLPSDYLSCIQIAPVITNFIMDFDWYLGFNICNWLQNLFFRMHVPVVHTKWDLNFVEHILQSGTNFFPAGYMGTTRIVRDDLAPDLESALQGRTIWGDMREPLSSGKVFGRQTAVHAGDLQAVLGWNFLMSDWYHVGIGFRTVVPTGNRPENEFLFEAITGNGKFWEVGGQFTSHVNFWNCNDERHVVGAYLDANITHFITTRQKRSYDFKNNGNGSRYMLLEELDTPSQNLFLEGPAGEAAPNQYQSRLIPAVNLSTLQTHISIKAQIDMVVKLAYFNACGFEFDLGYNFWYRSAEHIACRQRFVSNRFALKGDAQVYGFGNDALQTPVALNVTQHNATLNNGQGNLKNITFNNENADNPTTAANATTDLFQLNTQDSMALSIPQSTINTSNPAIFLSDADISERSVLMPRSYSNKLFTYIGYSWKVEPSLSAYIGLGASREWATTHVCKNGAQGQWSVWFKGGIAY